MSHSTDPRGLSLHRWAAVVLAATVAETGVGLSMHQPRPEAAMAATSTATPSAPTEGAYLAAIR